MSYTPSFLVWDLGRWANDMWVRFGGHGVKVYLVGSAIHSPHHKDVDISIVLPDDFCRDRYGMLENEWFAEQTRMIPDANGTSATGALKMNAWAPAHRRWAKEVGGLVPGLAKYTVDYGPPDLKVMSENWQEQAHRNKPRIRLDTVEGEDGSE